MAEYGDKEAPKPIPAAKITELRKALNLTKEDLARTLKLSVATIYRYEAEGVPEIRADNVDAHNGIRELARKINLPLE